MTPQELKNSILQLAIQGKLVEQRPEEGTAEELYKQIQAEKQALIKAGKIKKEKPLPEITEDEKPFDIPESWMCVRLGDCTSYAHTKEKVISSEIDAEAWSLDLEDIEKDTGKIVNFCKAGNRSITGDKVVFHKGQILYSKLRPYLKKILVAPEDGICTPELVPFFAFGGIDAHYLVSVLKAPHVDYVINAVTYGVKMPRVGTETMINLLVPLPPLAEQKRIVAKIEELLPLIERYEKAWSRLEDFNKRFPGDMQKSILQMAIQGKLVEQRPEEGTGEELYLRIQAEKQALIKAGKIKKEKPLPEITEDEVPFEIPESWKWVRFSDIAVFINGDRGANYPNRDEYVSDGVAWINTGHITPDGYLDASTMNYITEEKYNSLRSGKIEPGDLVYCLRGATFGKTARIEPYTRGAVASSLMIIRLFYTELREYIYTYLKSPMAYQQLHLYNNGSAQPNLGAKDVVKYLIPLPPIAEQKRIVARLEELLPLCERLK